MAENSNGGETDGIGVPKKPAEISTFIVVRGERKYY